MLTSAAMAERKSWVSKFANSIKNIGQSSDQSDTLKIEAISQLNDAANAKADDIENSLVGGRWKYLELNLGATRNDDNKNKGSVSVKSVYGLKETKNSFIFNQSSFIHYDGRSTVNLGFGARSINDDETYILGLNVFYDYEIEAKHGRASLGIEAFTRDLFL